MREDAMNAERLLGLYERVADTPNAIEHLRRFVLALAVRGKLVAQDPTEKVAERFTDRGGYDWLAPTWRTMKFGEYCDIEGGNQPPKSHFIQTPKPGYVRLFQIRDMGENPDPVYIPENSTNRFCREGEILIGRYGASVGKIFRAQEGAYNVALTKFVWPQDAFVKEFAFILLKSDLFQNKLSGVSRSAQAGFNKRDLGGIDLPLPPLAEQHRIVAKVEELMALLDRLEETRTVAETTRDRLTAASLSRLTAPDTTPEAFPDDARFALNALPKLTARADQVQSLRQTILDLAVRGRLTEQDPNDEPVDEYLRGLSDLPPKSRNLLQTLTLSDCGGKLPKTWCWLPLGSIIRKIDAGWSPQCENHPRLNDDEWGVLKTTAVQPLSFDAMQHKKLPEKLEPRLQYEAQIGDILVTRAGPKNRVGVSCVVDVPCPKLMISDKLIRFHAMGELSARYIALTLNTGYTLDQIEAAKSGMAVMQMNISQNKLRAIPIPLPPLSEQHRIVTKVDELMVLCDRLETALATTATTKQCLLESLLHEVLGPPSESMTEAA